MQLVCRQRIGKHVLAETNRNTTIELLLEMVFYARSVQGGYKEDNWGYENEHVRCIGQGEARHTKYRRLKLGGGQAYGRSSD
jgi:hypothetical protein